MTKQKKGFIQESQGVSKSEITSTNSIFKLKQKRERHPDSKKLTDGILNGDISALSRAITIIESKNKTHTTLANTIIENCLPHANKSIRIGITGVPGVGKSTFIETFGKHLSAIGKRVAVLAVDPSSSITKGSILGDKTRMDTLAKDPNAFIRPSASGDSLGGVARKTRESIILCEAAGYNAIIVETVGVGQSETAVHSMVDFFLLLKLAGAGDELQGIKRGIIEMADAIVINKADGDNKQQANLAQVEFKRALHLYPEKASRWQPKVTTCSALMNDNIDAIWDMLQAYFKLTSNNGYFSLRRKEQNKFWLMQTIEDRLKTDFLNQDKIKVELKKQISLVENQLKTPFAAAEYLLNLDKI